MQIYLVGGAVRDQLLGLPVHEKDWMVVGSSSKQMLELGYRQVGKDFPVFLHPDTNEEHALARTERKKGHGYGGFEVEANASITLEEDLMRRDLTINAIAQDNHGKLIDPYQGINDLNQRVLRHVSSAFVEDPLRVLRVARFHAKLQHMGFSVAPKTLALMKTISASGELQHLAAERVWKEFAKGLGEKSPQAFIQTLYQCGALEVLLPELSLRFHQADNLRDTRENIGKRTLNALSYAANQNYATIVRWAITCHATEQLARPKNIIAKRISLPTQQQSAVRELCKRMRAPNDFSRLAIHAAQYIDFIIQANTAKPDLVVSLLDSCDAWRRPEQFDYLLQVAECLMATHTESPLKNLGSITFLRKALETCAAVNPKEFVALGLQGEEIGKAIYNARKMVVANLKQQFA